MKSRDSSKELQKSKVTSLMPWKPPLCVDHATHLPFTRCQYVVFEFWNSECTMQANFGKRLMIARIA
eukprot:4933631-Karenia_brevis.AAC.1